MPPRHSTRRHGRFLLLLAMAVAGMGALCDPPAQPPAQPSTAVKPTAISRERAIEIARKDVSFPPESIEAVQVKSELGGRAVWRVTFKGRLPDSLPGLFETRIFEIDLRTGEIVGASIN